MLHLLGGFGLLPLMELDGPSEEERRPELNGFDDSENEMETPLVPGLKLNAGCTPLKTHLSRRVSELTSSIAAFLYAEISCTYMPRMS